MFIIYFFSIFILPLSFHYPYHFSFFSLIIGGVLHIFSEFSYLTNEKNILRKRKTFPPIIFIGSLLLTSIGIGWYLGGYGKTSDINSELYYRFLYILLGFLIFLSILPKITNNYNINIFFILPFFFIGGFYPLEFSFFIVHIHNLIPWFFLAKEKGKLIYLHTFLIGIVLPLITLSLFIGLDLSISQLALLNELEIDLFQHVIPSLSPFSNELILLSLFGYSQAIHYYLWIFLIPSRPIKERFSGFIPEFLFFIGFSKRNYTLQNYFILTLWIVSIGLFIYFPTEWRRLYFVLSAGHVFLEIPILLLMFL